MADGLLVLGDYDLPAGEAGDLDAFDDFLHPDVVVHAPMGLSTISPSAWWFPFHNCNNKWTGGLLQDGCRAAPVRLRSIASDERRRNCGGRLTVGEVVPLRGPEAEKAEWRDALRAMPDVRHDIQEVISLGSTIAARAIVTGTLQGDFAGISANGKSFRIDQGLFAHVRDDKIVEAWEIVDTGSLLRQLGAVLEVGPDR